MKGKEDSIRILTEFISILLPSKLYSLYEAYLYYSVTRIQRHGIRLKPVILWFNFDYSNHQTTTGLE